MKRIIAVVEATGNTTGRVIVEINAGHLRWMKISNAFVIHAWEQLSKYVEVVDENQNHVLCKR